MFTLNNGGVLEVVLWATSTLVGELRLVFQLQLQANGPANAAQIATDLADYLLGFVSELAASVVEEVTFTGFSWNTLDDVVVSGFIPFASPVPGTQSTDPLPDAVAMLVYMNTGEAHRQLRKYLPGFAEASIGTNGLWNSATLTAVMDIEPYFMDTYNAISGRDWHYGHAKAGVGASWVEPISFAITALPAYQRRRKRGRGA